MGKYDLTKEEFRNQQLDYDAKVEACSGKPYTEQRGWGIVKPVMDIKAIAPLCKFPYRGHPHGCSFCNKKRRWYDVCDPDQPVWAIYFSMNLHPLWTKLAKKWPHWTVGQVQNNRYWQATKKKNLKAIEIEFLQAHPGPWCRVLNRAPGHITYAFGISYNPTMSQIGVELQWPPEPHPITIQFVGRPKPDVDLSWAPFILSEETVKNPPKRPRKAVEQYTEEEHLDIVDMAQGLNLKDFEHLL